jgi:hypothetical protein
MRSAKGDIETESEKNSKAIVVKSKYCKDHERLDRIYPAQEFKSSLPHSNPA